MTPEINRLITIPISHYCEKARWGLEWAHIPYVEKRHLQGFHLFATLLAAKTDSTPVLIASEGVFSDSTDILKWCDSKTPPDRKLYPKDEALRKKVEALEDEFDEGLGVSGRLWMYTYMLDELPLILRYSKTHGIPAYQLKLMPFVFPVMKNRVKAVLNFSPTSRQESALKVDEVFRKVEQMLSDGRKFLVGDQFSAADLTFAALAAAVLIPGNYGVTLPKLDEFPKEMSDQVMKWRQTQAGEFALKLFADYR